MDRVDLKNTNDVGIVTHYNGKPFTGLGFHLHENGTVKIECEYLNGLKNGVYIKYSENGKKIEEANFKDDVQNGFYRQWYDNGQLKFECRFVKGTQIGFAKTWDSGEYVTTNHIHVPYDDALTKVYHISSNEEVKKILQKYSNEKLSFFNFDIEPFEDIIYWKNIIHYHYKGYKYLFTIASPEIVSEEVEIDNGPESLSEFIDRIGDSEIEELDDCFDWCCNAVDFIGDSFFVDFIWIDIPPDPIKQEAEKNNYEKICQDLEYDYEDLGRIDLGRTIDAKYLKEIKGLKDFNGLYGIINNEIHFDEGIAYFRNEGNIETISLIFVVDNQKVIIHWRNLVSDPIKNKLNLIPYDVPKITC